MKKTTRGRKSLKLKGKMFGLWKVLRKAKPKVYKNGFVKSRWVCKCTGCGVKRRILTGNLRADKSLGCANCRRTRKGARNAKIVSLREKKGWTLKRIAEKFKISVPRVKYIIDREMAA